VFAPDAQYRMKAHREAGTDPGELQRGAQKAGLVAPAVLAVIVFVAVSSAEQIGRVANPSVDELCGENAPGPDGPAPVVEHLVNHIEAIAPAQVGVEVDGVAENVRKCFGDAVRQAGDV
jgi:hypothetical protein